MGSSFVFVDALLVLLWFHLSLFGGHIFRALWCASMCWERFGAMRAVSSARRTSRSPPGRQRRRSHARACKRSEFYEHCLTHPPGIRGSSSADALGPSAIHSIGQACGQAISMAHMRAKFMCVTSRLCVSMNRLCWRIVGLRAKPHVDILCRGCRGFSGGRGQGCLEVHLRSSDGTSRGWLGCQ